MAAPSLSPGALEALDDLLGTRPAWRRSPAILAIGAALEELAVTLEEVADGRPGPQAADRGSLVCDVDLALTRVGSHLEKVTSPDLKTLRRDEVAKLAATLDEPAESRRVAGVARRVLDQLKDDAALRAAWDDAIATFADGAATADTCRLAVDQLNELLVARGHELWLAHNRIYELVRERKLDDARSALLQPPVDDVTVAWVAFGNADLERAVLRVGQTRFFSGQLGGLKVLRDKCTQEGHPEFAPIDELTDYHLDNYFDEVEAEHVVFARVELDGDRANGPPEGTRMPPLTWARHYVAGLVEAAGFRHGGTDWVLLNGGCYFTARGSDGGTAGFSDPRRDAERASATNPRLEPTGWRLGELPETFANALAQGQPAARDAVEAIEWHRDVAKLADPQKRVALHVRRFEVQWSTGDPGGWQTWEQPVRHYLRDLWCCFEQDDLMF